MSIPHIISQIVNTPLYLMPDKLAAIMAVLLPRDGGGGIDLSTLVAMQGGAVQAAAVPAVREPNAAEEGRIAVIPVLGSLVNRKHGFSGDSGLRSYRTLAGELGQALEDETIGGIILDIDSFGGMAAGCERVARYIAQAAQVKPVYAVVDLNCFSAAYYLAAGCTRIILTDASAGVGSIGCISLHYDRSQRNEKEGDVYTAVFFGERKDDFSPHRPLDKDMAARMQAGVDRFGLQFARTVAELRGMDLEKVLATQAGVFFGGEAVDIGLADGIAPFGEAAAMLAAEMEDRKKRIFAGGLAMTTRERFAALLANDDGPSALAELGYVRAEQAEKDAYEKGRTAGIAEGLEQARQTAAEVADLMELAQLEAAQAIGLMRQGCSASEAREAIQTMRAGKSQKQVVLSTVDPAAVGKHELIAACEAMGSQA